jgi:tetratricopeptide (TPR) repeat protein
MARIQPRIVAMMAIVLSGTFTGTAAAQISGRGVNPNAPRLMVGTFKTPDKKLGPDVAESIREHISGDMSYRTLYVLPKQDVNATLEASGYSTTDALLPADANALAKLLRADEYIEGSVEKTATGYTVTGYLILTRDMNLVQPLGTFEGAKVDQAVDKLSKSYQDAHNKTFENEKNCRLLAREGKAADAQKQAESGIKAFPKSTWLRFCQLTIYKDTKRPAPEVLKVVEEILDIDPKSKPALNEAVNQYDLAGNKEKKVEALMALYTSDPTNSKLQETVVRELAASGQMDKARPIIEKAVQDNPGDVGLVRLYWLILASIKDYKKSTAVGEEMVKMDTSLADTTYYSKQIAAYAADSNFAKAAENAAKATAKYPKEATLWVVRGQLERKVGQTQQSVESFKRALAIDPKAEGARLQIINSMVEQLQYDSAFIAIKEAQAAGEDPNVLATIAVAMGNRTFQSAQKSTEKTIDSFKKALPYLNYADQTSKEVATKTNAKYLIGISNFFILQMAATEAPKTKSCELAKVAAEALLAAQVNLPAGGSMDPKTVGQLMGALPQFEAPVAGQVKAFCK